MRLVSLIYLRFVLGATWRASWRMSAALVLALIGCAHSPPVAPAACTPYTSEQAVGEWVGDWFGDRGPTILTVRNRCAYPVQATVACPSSDPESDGWAYCWVDVAARGEASVLIQESNRDTREQSCVVAKWWQK